MTPRRRPRQRKVFQLDRQDQVDALSSPIRIEVIETFQTRGQLSVRELAQAMDRTPDSLYYHVRKLVAVGVLVVAEKRRSGAREEAVYGLAAPVIAMPYRPESPSNRAAYERAGAAVVRKAEREYRASVAGGGAVCHGARRETLVSRYKARLTPEGLAELNRRLRELESFLERENARGKGRYHALTTVLAPLEPAPRRRTT